MQTNSSMPDYAEVVAFSERYSRVHPFITAPVCITSLVANVLMSLILSSKNLRCSTNYLLVAGSVCNGILNVLYLFFVIHNYIQQSNFNCDSYTNSYWWTAVLLIFAHCSFHLHSMSSWLAVALSSLRCVQIYTKNDRYTAISVAQKLILAVVLGVSLLSIPNLYAFSVKQVPISSLESRCVAQNHSVVFGESWIIGVSETGEKLGTLAYRIAFESSAIFFYVIPCLLLVITMAYLITTLSTFESRRNKLQRKSNSCWRVQRHTSTLLVILSFFVATQLPQGILTFLCSLLTQQFRRNVYQSLGELMDLLSLLNGLVSFILYCFMSSLFRSAFAQLFQKSTAKTSGTQQRKSIDSVRNRDCYECPTHSRNGQKRCPIQKSQSL